MKWFQNSEHPGCLNDRCSIRSLKHLKNQRSVTDHRSSRGASSGS